MVKIIIKSLQAVTGVLVMLSFPEMVDAKSCMSASKVTASTEEQREIFYQARYEAFRWAIKEYGNAAKVIVLGDPRGIAGQIDKTISDLSKEFKGISISLYKESKGLFGIRFFRQKSTYPEIFIGSICWVESNLLEAEIQEYSSAGVLAHYLLKFRVTGKNVELIDSETGPISFLNENYQSEDALGDFGICRAGLRAILGLYYGNKETQNNLNVYSIYSRSQEKSTF